MSINSTLELICEKFDIKEMYPFGIELTPHDAHVTFQDIDPATIHELIKIYRIVVVRQSLNIPKLALIECAQNIGPLLPWDFGVVMEMRAHEEPKNYLFTHGPVPFHWDGAFHQEPRYLLFHCIEAPLADCGGETLFANTHYIWSKASIDEQSEWMGQKIKYKTEKRAHYGGEIEVTMVQKHPHTQETILRFAEPVPPSMLNPVEMQIDGLNEEEKEHWLNELVPYLYNPQNCYQHTWRANDIVLADNFSLLHGRRAFKAFSPRFLQRIQIL